MTLEETAVVPAELVGELRTGLYEQIGTAAEELDLLTIREDRERHPERYHKPLGDLDRVRSLLDAIGWRITSGVPVSVELDLERTPVGAVHRARDKAPDHHGAPDGRHAETCSCRPGVPQPPPSAEKRVSPMPVPLSTATQTLGARIRAQREALAISQEALADRSGTHWTFVGQVERGQRNLNLHNLLAAGLSLTLASSCAGRATATTWKCVCNPDKTTGRTTHRGPGGQPSLVPLWPLRSAAAAPATRCQIVDEGPHPPTTS